MEIAEEEPFKKHRTSLIYGIKSEQKKKVGFG